MLEGCFHFYRRWVAWISRYNEERGAESFRRCFGSPALFAEFLTEEGRSVEGYPPALLSALQVIHMAPGRIRLLKVDAFTYYVTRHLQTSTKEAADILLTWGMDCDRSGQASDLFCRLDQLAEATQMGIVHRIPTGGGGAS
jgi:hypothetical protein